VRARRSRSLVVRALVVGVTAAARGANTGLPAAGAAKFPGYMSSAIVLDLKTGKQHTITHGSSFYADGVTDGHTVFLDRLEGRCSQTADVVALDARTGKQRWLHPGGWVSSFSRWDFVVGPALVASSLDYSTLVLDATTGQTLWTVPIRSESGEIASLMGANENLVFEDIPIVVSPSAPPPPGFLPPFTLRAYDRGSGRLVWSHDFPSGHPAPSGVRGNAKTIVVTPDVIVLDAATGSELFQAPVPPIGEPRSGSEDARRLATRIVGSTLVYFDDQLAVHGVDSRTGTERWHQPTPSTEPFSFYPPMGLADSEVIAFNHASGKTANVVALDPSTGAVLWSAKKTGLNAVGRDVVLGSRGSTIVAFDARTGKTKWQATNPLFARAGTTTIGGDIAIVSGASLSCGD